MSRKHYKAIAEQFQTVRNLASVKGDASALAVLDILALKLAQVMQSDNCRFQTGRFLEAAGATTAN